MKVSEMEPIIKMRGWEVDVYVESWISIHGNVRHEKMYRVLDRTKPVLDNFGEPMAKYQTITKFYKTKVAALRQAMRELAWEAKWNNFMNKGV